MTSSSSNYIPLSARPVQDVRCEISDSGKVLVLHDAIYDPGEKCYFNIHIARPETGGLWSRMPFATTTREGDPFSAITAEKIKKIQAAYIEALKRIESRPSDNPIIRTTLHCTKYQDKKRKEQVESDIDTGTFLHPEKKIHQLMVDGILNPLGLPSVNASSHASTTPLADLSVAEGAPCNAIQPALPIAASTDHIPVAEECVKSPATDWSAQHREIRKDSLPKVPKEEQYASERAFSKQRQAMLTRHLNNVDRDIPFSAFVRNNSLKEIDEAFFDRLKKSLERIAKNPAGRGECVGRSPEQAEDDAKMWGVLIRWNSAACEYLCRNGGWIEGMEPLSIPLIEANERAWLERSKQKKSIAWSKESPWHWIPYLLQNSGLDPLSLELAKALVNELKEITETEKIKIRNELELIHRVN